MWPSLPTANHIADIANWFFIGSLVVGVVSTILIVWMAGVKEAYWEKDRIESSERIEGLQSEAEKARAAIAESDAKTATANENAAKANERTAQLKLALEKEIAERQPRRISPEQKAAILTLFKPEPKGSVVVVWKLYDEEAQLFGQSVLSVLQEAGFDAKEGPNPAAFGLGQFIIVRPGMFEGRSYAGSIQTVFRKVLNLEFGAQLRTDPTPDVGDVLLIIGSKP